MPSPARHPMLGFTILLGILYFAQGIAEPTEGLVAQPVRSLLRTWDTPPSVVGAFSAAIALPWCLKPLLGLLTDFVPLFGRRRKSYLLLASGVAALTLLGLWWAPPQRGALGWLIATLLVPTFAIAMADVAIDALMVEKGQPAGLTGRFQSVQWACSYAATIVTGSLGGYLAQHGLQTAGFLICGLALLPTIALVAVYVDEPRAPPAPRGAWRASVAQLRDVPRHRDLRLVAAFLFLWNFNPFSSAVLQTHMTDVLGFGEQFYGHAVSLLAVGAMVGSIGYGALCKRLHLPTLVHGAIALGILATAAYWPMRTTSGAAWISVFVGFTYMVANLIQFDLAARVCPPQIAGTVFATLMATTVLAMSSAYAVGGWLYETGVARFGAQSAFDGLVGLGVASTAACWLLAPRLLRALVTAQ